MAKPRDALTQREQVLNNKLCAALEELGEYRQANGLLHKENARLRKELENLRGDVTGAGRGGPDPGGLF